MMISHTRGNLPFLIELVSALGDCCTLLIYIRSVRNDRQVLKKLRNAI